MKSTVNQSHIRSINQRVILNYISQVDFISRASLSRRVKLSKVAIAENISFLLDLGIVKEAGTGKSKESGGRRPILLEFNREYKHIIAIDLVSEDAIFSLANLSGEIQNQFTIQVKSTSPYSTRLDLLKNAIYLLLSSQNLVPDDIAIIAISAPGIFQTNGIKYQANKQFQNWRMTDLSEQLEEAFTTEVLIVNDVNAAAIGELNHGAGKGFSNMSYISCGLGIGAGIILNKTLHEGGSNSAGEIGNFITSGFKESSTRLEDKVNINSLLNRIRQEAPKETLATLPCQETFSFKEVVNLWKSGDPFIEKCINDIAKDLGVAISNIVSLLNVDLIILGGEYQVFSNHTLPIINEIVVQNTFSPVQVVQSKLKCNASIYGLLTIAKERVFDQICAQNIK